MVYRNNTGRLGCWLHQCVLRNTLAGSKTVVSTSRDDPVLYRIRCFESISCQLFLSLIGWEYLFSGNRMLFFENIICEQFSIRNVWLGRHQDSTFSHSDVSRLSTGIWCAVRFGRVNLSVCQRLPFLKFFLGFRESIRFHYFGISGCWELTVWLPSDFDSFTATILCVRKGTS